MKRTAALTTAVLLSLALISTAAATIEPGEIRTAVGKVSAVDIKAGALVVEAPVEGGTLTVGVTMKGGAPVMRDGRAGSLGDLNPGDWVTLKYTREGDRLIGLEVRGR
jgi:hypothetical protein